MSKITIVAPVTVALILGAFAGIGLGRSRGDERSRRYAVVLALAAVAFFVIGFVALLTHTFAHVSAHVVFGIVFILFGVTCGFHMHTQLEIARLKKELSSQEKEIQAQQPAP